MKIFEVLYEPISNDPQEDLANYYDMSGNNLPTRSSQRAAIIQILVFCGVLENETEVDLFSDFTLDQICIDNNIYVKILDNFKEN